MGNKKIKSDGIQHSFSGYKSYSIDEILASGGTTAFATKLGKSPQTIEGRLRDLPEDGFLTKEEVKRALETLSNSK